VKFLLSSCFGLIKTTPTDRYETPENKKSQTIILTHLLSSEINITEKLELSIEKMPKNDILLLLFFSHKSVLNRN
jgi:hypothetical protein